MDTPATQSAAFIPLIQDFVEMRMTGHEFETRYLQLLNEHAGSLNPRVSNVLHYLFCELDAYVADRHPQAPDDQHQVEEYRLRARARETLSDLSRIRDGKSSGAVASPTDRAES